MRKQQNFQWKEITMGTCYYPEHWSRELWQDDLQRMKAAGITVIRVAEFAWNKVEPEENVFVFDFWDEDVYKRQFFHSAPVDKNSKRLYKILRACRLWE